MKIAIVGAGMAGIGAARLLKMHSHDVTLWEKSAHVGGRVGTYRLEQNNQATFFDHGAQNVKMSNRVLDSELDAAGFSERVLIGAPTCLRDGSQVLPPDKEANAEPKWTGKSGMRTMPQFLAQDLDVRLDARISRLQRDNDSWILRDDNNRVLDSVERVIITLPAPQAADLLEASDEPNAERIERLRRVQYSRCLSVLLRYEVPSDDLDFYALLSKDRSAPLLWLARENAKGFVPDNATALIAQLGHEISCDLWDESDQKIVRQTANWIHEIDARFVSPTWSFIKRWRYSQPRNTIGFEDANAPEDRVLVCGDGLSQARVPDAYESGKLAANWLIGNNQKMD